MPSAATSRASTSPAPCGGCNVFTFMPLVWASGGDILAEDGSKATLDTPADARRDRPLPLDGQEGASAGKRPDRYRRQLLRRLRRRQYRHLAVGRLRHRQPQQPVPRHRLRRHLPAGQGWRLVLLRRRRQFRRHQGHARRSPWSRSSSTSPIPSKARRSWPNTAACRCAATSPRRRSRTSTRATRSRRRPWPKAARPTRVVFNDLINSGNGPWTQMIGEVFFGDDVDGAIANAQKTMQSIIDAGTAETDRCFSGRRAALHPAGPAGGLPATAGSSDDGSSQTSRPSRRRAQAGRRRPQPAGSACSMSRRRSRWCSCSSSCRWHDGLDVAAQLAADGRAQLHRARQLRRDPARRPLLAARCASPVYYTVIVTIAIFAVAFPLALFVEKPRPLTGFYRTAFFMPVVVGFASASLLWSWLLNVDVRPVQPRSLRARPDRQEGQSARHLPAGVLVDHRHGRLEGRRLHHDHPDDRAAVDPDRAAGGGDHRRRPSAGSASGTSPCR